MVRYTLITILLITLIGCEGLQDTSLQGKVSNLDESLNKLVNEAREGKIKVETVKDVVNAWKDLKGHVETQKEGKPWWEWILYVVGGIVGYAIGRPMRLAIFRRKQPPVSSEGV